jgi:hypothetical protein
MKDVLTELDMLRIRTMLRTTFRGQFQYLADAMNIEGNLITFDGYPYRLTYQDIYKEVVGWCVVARFAIGVEQMDEEHLGDAIEIEGALGIIIAAEATQVFRNWTEQYKEARSFH